MIVSEDKTLLKNKKFIAVFTFGVVCSLIGIILRGVYSNEAADCIDSYACGGDSLCFQNGAAYCCGYGRGSYSCGSYYYECSYYGSGYNDCAGLIVGEWVMGSLGLVALIVLIVIAKKHRKRNQLDYANSLIHRQNIIYSDAHQQGQSNQNIQPPNPNPNFGIPEGNINQSIGGNEYHRI